MKCEVKWHEDMWQEIKDATLTTISKDKGVYPTYEWKRKLLLCEHSPIRIGRIIVKLYDIPSYVATHIARHHVGIEKFISTRRSDRGFKDQVIDRESPVDMTLDLNFQAVISISRKRTCYCADTITIKVWQLVLDAIKEYEPELVSVCIPDCIYRGKCYEMFPCKVKYNESDAYARRVIEYRL